MAEKQKPSSSTSSGDWRRIPLCTFFKDTRQVFKLDSLGREILSIALPAAMALTADPIASLVDTAFIGRVEIIAGFPTDAPKKISGVHKRCWRYLRNVVKALESSQNLVISKDNDQKVEPQAS